MNKVDLPIRLIVEVKTRIDKYLAIYTKLSRTEIQKMIADKAITVDGHVILKPKFIVKLKSVILITKLLPKITSIIPEEMDLDIVYEDDHLAIINKKSGVVTHPAPGHYSHTLVNGLMFYFKKNLSSVGDFIRPGIVHRLDKDTSGLMIVAKTNEAHKLLSEMIKNREVTRRYLAVVRGQLKYEIMHLDMPIGRDVKNRKRMSVTNFNSKKAITHIYVQKIMNNKTLVECKLETGRTHQIRVHLAHIKYPIIGDPLYGNKIDNLGQRLHSYKLSFIHPITKKELHFEAPLPENKFSNLID